MIMQTYCFWRLIRGNVYSYLMVHEIQSLYNFLTGSNCIKSNHSDQMREIFYYKQKSSGFKRIQRAKKTDFLSIKRISAPVINKFNGAYIADMKNLLSTINRSISAIS